MVKKKIEQEDTEREDLDAFEEFEADEEDLDAELEDDLEDDLEDADEDADEELEVPGLEEPPAAAAPKAPAKGKVPKASKAVTEEEFSETLLDLAPDVPVNLVAVIGKSSTSVGDLMKTRVGAVIDLGRPPGETVDLVANGRLIARGELVEMDGQLGVRILKMVK